MICYCLPPLSKFLSVFTVRVRKVTASIDEDERLITKFKKDETEKLMVSMSGRMGNSLHDSCAHIV